ncbi:tRNA (uridine(34)/cytosine(34)/5-carboxymethylaminomethyluridine(34)-2'-O)-methyltransferase TrmL [Entomomonas sp. E2T0]|uniref:tRNA (uridine(34)/cytosine(34)/5- carboxymethylaminomethyluridine(34)-2'-O)- methyltransferase TrmL n=1 Tax=Entomomonas sp. E2T0 TaxID=2930213 RepID=UPI0022283E6F|nr:tRNA (uridine(34)/cytosine(34)/5-carboxymethylaminomethyluridine(34)-2'-O)-methyltransferase TrmL [Entomomonas sp. E2T0]UYZ85053.1 tRNA (uridine(34)/cytosine(34)/5-carboxymethylaminomethyluridine(34)-2'-O)-methyltransferase TrmL [Entomomonas sp. E2T0]
MFHIILFQPEIPPNTGNIIRLCANIGCQLHLIKPLGFILDDKRLRRAGLDYHEFAQVKQYDSLQDCLQILDYPRLFAFTTKATHIYSDVQYQLGDALLFGPETRGLPMEILNSLNDQQKVKLPMQPNSRSLNLSNTVAIASYQVWQQLGYKIKT